MTRCAIKTEMMIDIDRKWEEVDISGYCIIENTTFLPGHHHHIYVHKVTSEYS